MHRWIFCQIKVGGGGWEKIWEGGTFNPKKCKFFILFTLKNAIFSIFTPWICKFLQFYPPKMLILTIFAQKSAIFGNFPLLKVKNRGEFFQNFYGDRGKNRFFWQNIHLCISAKIVAVLDHVHSAARESKYTKNRIHKCYNFTLLRHTVANTCFCICSVLPRSCLS